MRKLFCLYVAALAFVLLPVPRVRAADDDKLPLLKIGMLASFYTDIPASSIKTSTESFKKLIERDVGRAGETVTIEDPFEMAKQIADGKLHIAVFHGFEFAWVRKKFEGLEALTLAVNEQPEFCCYVLVRKDSAVKDFAGLKGKSAAVPKGSREESRTFVRRLTMTDAAGLKGYFKDVTKPDTLEDALDDVVDDAVQVTVVDSVALGRYEKRKPARFERLRVLQKSDIFPGTVVVYRPGKLDDETLKRIRAALLKASESIEGKRMLTIWKLTGFLEVPESYTKRLEAIAKAYPPPEEKE